jgi:hypothetical protein
MIAERGTYGLVSDLSREAAASRQTLYAWAGQGVRALEAAFTPAAPPLSISAELSRRVLTLLVETHPAARGIQAALGELTGQQVSLGTISAIVREAEQRALAIQATCAPPTARPIALDELYGNNRRGAYLHVVDTASHALWAAAGPLAVDADSWTLVLWAAQERGLRWWATSSDGGGAMDTALGVVDPDGQHGRDVWHVLHRCAQVQGRLDRRVVQLTQQTAAVARQAARAAAGRRPRGHHPRSDVAAHAAEVARVTAVATGVRYLSGVLRELLEVVVVAADGRLLDGAARGRELDAVLALLAEVGATAPVGLREQLQRLHRHLATARPGLLAFVPALDAVQQDVARAIGADGVDLLAWAWPRRAILGPDPDDLVAQLPATWRPAARRLLTAWASAVRASSAVENWHSILRPHLAVHRTLSPGLLALLTVWHNHRVFTRGARAGFSPLQLSGITDAPTDWLVALGYPPATARIRATRPARPPSTPPAATWPLAA